MTACARWVSVCATHEMHRRHQERSGPWNPATGKCGRLDHADGNRTSFLATERRATADREGGREAGTPFDRPVVVFTSRAENRQTLHEARPNTQNFAQWG